MFKYGIALYKLYTSSKLLPMVGDVCTTSFIKLKRKFSQLELGNVEDKPKASKMNSHKNKTILKNFYCTVGILRQENSLHAPKASVVNYMYIYMVKRKLGRH